MKLGKVTGQVALGKTAEALENANILMVDIDGNDIAALDRAGAKTGDRVLLATSRAAARYSMEAPADAVVVAVVKE
ncbi:MAG: hypothetical protein IJE81_05510 [Oscillospiraceae bacterium]|nr:hypothetical protein [Oscillospiraceae bacterium]